MSKKEYRMLYKHIMATPKEIRGEFYKPDFIKWVKAHM